MNFKPTKSFIVSEAVKDNCVWNNSERVKQCVIPTRTEDLFHLNVFAFIHVLITERPTSQPCVSMATTKNARFMAYYPHVSEQATSFWFP
jgi:hypothetical protein